MGPFILLVMSLTGHLFQLGRGGHPLPRQRNRRKENKLGSHLLLVGHGRVFAGIGAGAVQALREPNGTTTMP